MKIKVKTEHGGRFKLEAVKPDGSRRLLADWFDNLITDGGLDRMGSNSDYLTWCQVGSGSTPPVVTNTALGNRLAATNTISTNTEGAQGSAPYFGWRRKTFRLGVQGVDRNYSEVGVSWTNTGTLYSHALILDSGGSPTSITVLSDEFLDVTYELRSYPGTVDVTGTVILDGITYDWVSRCSSVTNSTTWARGIFGTQLRMQTTTAYTGAIGAITGAPTGTQASMATSVSAYSPGSLESTCVVSAALGEANIGGISSIRLNGNGTGAYQFGFTPAIPKDDTKVLSLTITFAWARKTL